MKRILNFILIGMLWSVHSAFAQIITLNPPFPSISDSITLIYDASQGSAGLKDCTDIYIHTGVITAGPNSTSWSNVPMAWGSGDPKWKLTNLGNNKFRYGFRPVPFFGINANATVYRLGFVFRNRTGSITGKTSSGGDIFTPMYQAGQNALAFIGQESRFILANLNQTINFTAASNFPGTLRVYSNGVEVASGPGQGQFSGSIPTNNGGTKKIVLRSDANPTLADSFTVRINQPTAIESLPAGIEDGINVLNQNSVILCLRAPFKNVVYAIGEFNNWDLTDENQMKRTPDGKF